MIARSVRQAKSNDIKTLIALCAEHAHFERAYYDIEGKEAKLREALFGATPRLRAWVALVQDEVVGYITATEQFSTWSAGAFVHMDCLFVRPGHRNGGIGIALLNAVIQYARDNVLHEVQWQTPVWNAAARRFYRRHGGIEQRKIRFTLPIA